MVCFPLLVSGQQINNVVANQLNIGGVDQIEVTWESVNELEWCHFVIERDSNFNNVYAVCDSMNAVGTTFNTTNYLYTDFRPFTYGVTYCYRLKLIIDNPPQYCDSFLFYSDTACVEISVGLTDPALTEIAVFPNPAKEKVTIQSAEPINAIELFSIAGELVYRRDQINEPGPFEIDVAGQPKGTYLITIRNGKRTFHDTLLIE